MRRVLQVNHPQMNVDYTRITEYKHKPNQPEEVYKKPGTVIFKEYSVDEGDPYYPVPNPENQALYLKYKVRTPYCRRRCGGVHACICICSTVIVWCHSG